MAAWLAWGAAGIFAYPWLRWGALGSPLDIVLDLVAGLLFGGIAGALIRHTWLRSLTLDSRGPVLFRQKRHGFNNEIKTFKSREICLTAKMS